MTEEMLAVPPVKKRVKKVPLTPKSGWHDATIKKFLYRQTSDEDSYVQWSIVEAKKKYLVDQIVEFDEVGDFLASVGGFREGEQFAASALVGRKARVRVRSRGGQQSADIIDVQPIGE